MWTGERRRMKTPCTRINRRILIVDDTRSIHDDFAKILCSTAQGPLDATEALLFGPSDNRSAGGFEMDSRPWA